jgi:hypothetical protein
MGEQELHIHSFQVQLQEYLLMLEVVVELLLVVLL